MLLCHPPRVTEPQDGCRCCGRHSQPGLPWLGFSAELGREGPGPSRLLRVPFHPRGAGERRVRPARAVQRRRCPAGVSAAPPGRAGPGPFAARAAQPSSGPGSCPGPYSLPFPFPTCLQHCLMCGRVTARGGFVGTDVPPVVTWGNKEPSVVQLQ